MRILRFEKFPQGAHGPGARAHANSGPGAGALQPSQSMGVYLLYLFASVTCCLSVRADRHLESTCHMHPTPNYISPISSPQTGEPPLLDYQIPLIRGLIIQDKICKHAPYLIHISLPIMTWGRPKWISLWVMKCVSNMRAFVYLVFDY